MFLFFCQKLNPDDVDCMLHEATCLVRMQKFKKALEGVDRASELPSSGFKSSPSRACTIKGEAFYHMGEFERSLLNYHRALNRCTNGTDEEEIRY